MAKSAAKSKPLSRSERAQICVLAAQLAAASGEDAIVVARKFAEFVGEADMAHHAALSAAVAEAAGRHEHLRGRKPSNSITVLSRAAEFLDFIGTDPAP